MFPLPSVSIWYDQNITNWQFRTSVCENRFHYTTLENDLSDNYSKRTAIVGLKHFAKLLSYNNTRPKGQFIIIIKSYKKYNDKKIKTQKY